MKNLTALFFFLIVVLSLHSLVLADEGDLKRAIVIFEEGKEVQALKEVDGTVIENFDHINAASVMVSAESLEELSDSGNIKRVEEDILIKTTGQVLEWPIPTMQTSLSWGSGYTGKGVKVAVIDSGIAPHPDLKIAGGVSMVSYTSSYADDNGHGTHVAGIIGALDNTIGTKGVAHGANLYAVKVFGSDNTAFLSDVIRGVDWAITNNMDIINLSLGTTTDSTAFKTIIQKAYAKGIWIFAASGNQGAFNPNGDIVEYPARYNEVIAVAAVDQSLKRAPFSSGGPAVDIAAPGVGIYSTYLGRSYTRMSGTSMATPYAAGQAALVKEAYPSLTIDQFRSVFYKNAKDLGAPGKDPIFGVGLLQAKSYVLPEFGKTATLNPAVALEASQTQLKGYEQTVKPLKAMLVLKDGNKVDVTSTAVWTSSNPAVASVSKGAVTLNAQGQTKVSAVYGQHKIEVDIIVEKNTDSFADVPSTYWAYKQIEEMKAKNIVVGYPGRLFKPRNLISREHVAVIVSRTVPMTQVEPFKAFPDVPESHDYFQQIKAVQMSGIFSGSSAGFRPSGKLSRAQMAKVIVKSFNLKAEGSHPFPDVKADHWATGYIDVLYQTGITTGSNGNFRPEDEVTRAELAVFLSRALKYKEENPPVN